jgi:hypothetical protein
VPTQDKNQWQILGNIYPARQLGLLQSLSTSHDAQNFLNFNNNIYVNFYTLYAIYQQGNITVCISMYTKQGQIAISTMFIWKCCGENVKDQSVLIMELSGSGLRRLEVNQISRVCRNSVNREMNLQDP